MCDIVPGYPIPALTLEKTGSGIEGSLYIFLMMRICIYTCVVLVFVLVIVLVFVLVLVYLRGSGIGGNLYIFLMMSIFAFILVFVYLRRRWLDDNIYISSMTRVAMMICICVILYYIDPTIWIVTIIFPESHIIPPESSLYMFVFVSLLLYASYLRPPESPLYLFVFVPFLLYASYLQSFYMQHHISKVWKMAEAAASTIWSLPIIYRSLLFLQRLNSEMEK